MKSQVSTTEARASLAPGRRPAALGGLLPLGVAAMAALLAGCSGAAPHLAGTNDAALEYTVLADPATGAALDLDLTAAGVKARLSAAQVPSEVDVVDGRVRVVVDADIAGAVDDLLAWRGGLLVFRAEDTVAIGPADTSGIRPMSGAGPAGEERWWQGPGEAIARVVRDTRLDRGHVLFAQRLEGGEYRTRVGASPPIVTLGLAQTPIAAVEAIERGRALALGLPPESVAPLARERAGSPRAQVLLARGSSLLEVLPIEQVAASPLVLRFGDDVLAYTRAHRSKLLLRSPVLPPLRRASAAPLPPRFGLAAACAVLPFLMSLAWLSFVRRFDRARPEPAWLVLSTFALGGLAIVPAALLEAGATAISPWLDPSVVTMGGQAWALPISILVATVVVGGAEEGAKFLGAWSLARHRREFDEPVDGIVYGCASALGFAAVENVKYFAFGRMSGTVIALRAFETVPAHMFFGALWGYAMGQTLVSRQARVWPLLALAALAHGTFDAILSTDGIQLLATALVLALAVAFVVVLRKALRHGAVRPRLERGLAAPPPTEPLPQSELVRTYFRVGSSGAFAASVAAMITCAVLLTVLGTAYELLHHRANVIVVSAAAVLLGLLGLAAWAVSATIPLDVAIDARGITFAGARTPWAAVLGQRVESRGRRAWVNLRTAEGVLRLGPAPRQTAEEIGAAVRAVTG